MSFKLISYRLADQLNEKKMISRRRLKFEIFKNFFIPKVYLEKLYVFMETIKGQLPELPLILIFEFFLENMDMKNSIREHIKETYKRPNLQKPVFVDIGPQLNGECVIITRWFERVNTVVAIGYMHEKTDIISNGEVVRELAHTKLNTNHQTFYKHIRFYKTSLWFKYKNGIYTY